MGFSGKVVLVTGASSGIGADVAIAFAQSGAKLVLVGRSLERLSGVANKITSQGSPEPLVIVGDVSVDAAKIIERTIQHFGQLDVLVNNAGFGRFNDTASTLNLEAFDSIFGTNCRAVVELSKLAIPHLETTNGNIVNVSSIAGLAACKSATSYCMSKAALDMYTKCASLELAPKGIRVNSVNPGTIQTAFLEAAGLDKARIPGFREKSIDFHPVGRLGTVSDTTNAILFLADEKSSFINGALLPADGGRLHSPKRYQ